MIDLTRVKDVYRVFIGSLGVVETIRNIIPHGCHGRIKFIVVHGGSGGQPIVYVRDGVQQRNIAYLPLKEYSTTGLYMFPNADWFESPWLKPGDFLVCQYMNAFDNLMVEVEIYEG